VDPEKGAWHFVLVRAKPEVPQALTLREINRALKAAGIQAEAVDWLSVAGLNASLLYLLKTVFEIGIGVLAAIVVLVLTNGLAFAVMEQTKEIGTMRAMGAQRSFVSRLYFLQSLALVLAGAALGSGAAYLLLKAIGRVGIPITNSYLFMLFGVSLLKPSFSAVSLLYSFAGAAVVAAAASLYPIHLATKLTVAQTMEAE
jgi:putative ABC transport system permease protein